MEQLPNAFKIMEDSIKQLPVSSILPKTPATQPSKRQRLSDSSILPQPIAPIAPQPSKRQRTTTSPSNSPVASQSNHISIDQQIPRITTPSIPSNIENTITIDLKKVIVQKKQDSRPKLEDQQTSILCQLDRVVRTFKSKDSIRRPDLQTSGSALEYSKLATQITDKIKSISSNNIYCISTKNDAIFIKFDKKCKDLFDEIKDNAINESEQKMWLKEMWNESLTLIVMIGFFKSVNDILNEYENREKIFINLGRDIQFYLQSISTSIICSVENNNRIDIQFHESNKSLFDAIKEKASGKDGKKLSSDEYSEKDLVLHIDRRFFESVEAIIQDWFKTENMTS